MGVIEGRREGGKGEGPRACNLVVRLDQAVTICSRTIGLVFARVENADSAFSRALQSDARGSDRLSIANSRRSKVGKCWKKASTVLWRV